jgi:hypothetical protein
MLKIRIFEDEILEDDTFETIESSENFEITKTKQTISFINVFIVFIRANL